MRPIRCVVAGTDVGNPILKLRFTSRPLWVRSPGNEASSSARGSRFSPKAHYMQQYFWSG